VSTTSSRHEYSSWSSGPSRPADGSPVVVRRAGNARRSTTSKERPYPGGEGRGWQGPPPVLFRRWPECFQKLGVMITAPEARQAEWTVEPDAGTHVDCAKEPAKLSCAAHSLGGDTTAIRFCRQGRSPKEIGRIAFRPEPGGGRGWRSIPHAAHSPSDDKFRIRDRARRLHVRQSNPGE
jgi:hypothetical protein